MIYTIDELCSLIAPVAKRHGLKAVYANGNATESSDVDLLVDTTGTSLTSLFSLGQLYCELEEALSKPIDLLTISSLEQAGRMESDLDFRERIEKERLKIYDAA